MVFLRYRTRFSFQSGAECENGSVLLVSIRVRGVLVRSGGVDIGLSGILGVGVLGLGPKTAAALALALFVAGHAYQGWRGMLLVAVAGYSLTYLYLSSGSLVLPIAVHVLIDVMAMVVLPAVATRRTAPAAG